MNAMFDAPMNLYAAQLNAAKRFVDACVASTQRMDSIFLEATKDLLSCCPAVDLDKRSPHADEAASTWRAWP